MAVSVDPLLRLPGGQLQRASLNNPLLLVAHDLAHIMVSSLHAALKCGYTIDWDMNAERSRWVARFATLQIKVYVPNAMERRDVVLLAVLGLVALLLLLGAGAAALWWVRRRRKREADEEAAAKEPVKQQRNNGFLSLKTPLISTKTLG
ncbi:hypothetical protein FOCC_FOCC012929 [Frankliniella occidentalis]|nr:hypothetical protein FOCC_FOCC012929 [Frankliniella occidentalis]